MLQSAWDEGPYQAVRARAEDEVADWVNRAAERSGDLYVHPLRHVSVLVEVVEGSVRGQGEDLAVIARHSHKYLLLHTREVGCKALYDALVGSLHLRLLYPLGLRVEVPELEVRIPCCNEVPLLFVESNAVDELAQAVGCDSFLSFEVPNEETLVVCIAQRY